MKKFVWVGIFIIFALLFCSIDTLAYTKEGIYSIIAGKIWITWSLYYFLATIVIILAVLYKDIKKRSFIGIVSLFITTIVISFNLTSFPLEVWHESTQQMVDGLSLWKEPDLGYTQTAFLGNLGRPYLLISLPSLLFGISITAQRIGYLLFFLTGIYIFYAGIKIYYQKHPLVDNISSLAPVLIIASPLIVTLLRTFDQITFPLTITLHALGWLLIVLKKTRLPELFAFTWIYTLLTISYTPSLATWSLLTIFCSIFLVKNLFKNKFFITILLLASIIISATSLVNGFRIRKDFKIINKEINSEERLTRLKESFEYFFVKKTVTYSHNVLFLGAILLIPTLLYLISAIVNKWGLLHIGISIGVVTIIVASGQSKGYANPPVWFGIHRAMVAIPFLIFGITDVLFRMKPQIRSSAYYLVIVIATIYISIQTSTIMRRWEQTVDIRSLVLRETINTAKAHSIDLYNKVTLATYTTNSNFVFFNDTLQYFFPKANVLNQECNNDFNEKPAIIYLDKNHPCYNTIHQALGSLAINYYPLEYYNDELLKRGIEVDQLEKIVLK